MLIVGARRVPCSNDEEREFHRRIVRETNGGTERTCSLLMTERRDAPTEEDKQVLAVNLRWKDWMNERGVKNRSAQQCRERRSAQGYLNALLTDGVEFKR